MAITVNLYYTGTKGSAAAFAQEMIASGTVEAIRLEEGNLQYEYFQPLEDPETILLIDSWQDQQALDRHHASPMMEAFQIMIGLLSGHNVRLHTNSITLRV